MRTQIAALVGARNPHVLRVHSGFSAPSALHFDRSSHFIEVPASKSIEVSNEWKEAIEQKKDLLPLLLDETPLPPQLSEFQWIDFRDTVGLAHCAAESPAAKPLILAKGSRFPLVLFATASIAIMSLSSLWLFYTLNNSSQKTLNNFFQKRFSPIQDSSQVGPLLELPPIVNSAYDNSLFLVVSVLLAIVLCLILLVRWRARRRSINEKLGFSMKEIERKIAKELETEIFRRTKGLLHVGEDGTLATT